MSRCVWFRPLPEPTTDRHPPAGRDRCSGGFAHVTSAIGPLHPTHSTFRASGAGILHRAPATCPTPDHTTLRPVRTHPCGGGSDSLADPTGYAAESGHRSECASVRRSRGEARPRGRGRPPTGYSTLDGAHTGAGHDVQRRTSCPVRRGLGRRAARTPTDARCPHGRTVRVLRTRASCVRDGRTGRARPGTRTQPSRLGHHDPVARLRVLDRGVISPADLPCCPCGQQPDVPAACHPAVVPTPHSDPSCSGQRGRDRPLPVPCRSADARSRRALSLAALPERVQERAASAAWAACPPAAEAAGQAWSATARCGQPRLRTKA